MSEMPTLEQFVPDFIEQHSKSRKPSTQLAHKQILNQTLLPLFGKTPMNEITRKCGAILTRECRQRELSPKTTLSHLSVLSMVIKTAYDLEILNEVVKFKRPKIEEAEKKYPLLPEQVQSLLGAISNVDLYTMVYMAAYTGMRIGEIRALQWKHFRPEDDFSKFTLVAGFSGRTNDLTTGKSKEMRLVRLRPRLVELLKARKRVGDYVFFDSSVPGSHSSPVSYYFCHDAGIVPAGKRAGVWVPEFGFHTLRHTFGTEMAKRPGMTAFRLQRIMGHERLSTTERYIAIRDEDANGDNDPLGGVFG